MSVRLHYDLKIGFYVKWWTSIVIKYNINT
jgi:hypothetical protein